MCELECLLWTAEGKTAEEVASILGLSVFTVNRYVSVAVRKLNCVNKHHAAIRALRGGLICSAPEGAVRRRPDGPLARGARIRPETCRLVQETPNPCHCAGTAAARSVPR